MRYLRLERLRSTPAARVSRRGSNSAEIAVEGLVCSLCAARVASALRSLPGVTDASCSLEDGVAIVRLSGAEVEADDLIGAVEGSAIFMPVRRALSRLLRRRPNQSGKDFT